jgi:2-hydroxycyclohexanecarboxyl-CoA dehydrogenase
VSNILDLKGRSALVTGAGQGVGRQIALHFAAHNAGGIVINDYYLDRAEAVAEEVRALGGAALAIASDVSDYAAVTDMVGQATAAFGGVDILVNNAGNAGATKNVGDVEQFWDTGPDEWAKWFSVNLYGVLNCSRAAITGMMERKYGRVVTIISDAGRVGEAHLAVYSAAKAGSAGFMRALAKGVGRYNVTANCVALAGVNTPGIADLIPDEEAIRKATRSLIIRRLGEPEDAANMVLFLASDASSWVTGQTYPVNGGYSVSV